MKKEHWEQVYRQKQPNEVSWTQDVPEISLFLFRKLQIPLNVPVIDVGGGDSRLVDHLLELGYTDITVLDISAAALERARKRLGANASRVHWIESDILDFTSEKHFGLWHDRAVFHFLTKEEEISRYAELAAARVSGHMIIGTFSEQGPKKCSGLDITQYNEQSLPEVFARHFEKRDCVTEDHVTPFDTIQNFIFCTFKTVKQQHI